MVILIVLILLFFVHISHNKRDYTSPEIGFWDITQPMLTALFSVVVLASVCFCVPKVATAHTIDRKIVMYQETNAQIEEKIKTSVEYYMGYEKETFKELKGTEDIVTLVNMYPELKSDNLIKSEIEVYVENNKKIQELKEEKIEISKYKWWIYFGR